MNQSTWDPVPVRHRIAERMVPRIGPETRAVDDVSRSPDARISVADAHQLLRGAGQAGQPTGQVAVSV